MAPRIDDSRPNIYVTDMDRAVAFYRDRLGFKVLFLHGTPPFYGEVARDGARLALRHVDATPFIGDIRAREHLMAAFMPVFDIDALYAELRAAGVDFHQELKKQPYGIRDFVVRDPDANLLAFGEG
jgi:catechol 2,3-dioxygenase-like lactoylglutathione lyase family enzyme